MVYEVLVVVEFVATQYDTPASPDSMDESEKLLQFSSV
jgi:hypothetical protein